MFVPMLCTWICFQQSTIWYSLADSDTKNNNNNNEFLYIFIHAIFPLEHIAYYKKQIES